jgi:exodeoxyribonuclease VII large subunit
LALPRQRLDQAGLRLGTGLERNRAVHERRAASVGARLGPHLLERALERRRARLDAVAARLQTYPPTLARRGEALSALSRALATLDPARPKPGFARVEAADGTWLTSAAALTPGLKVQLVMPDGTAGATVDGGAPRVAAATPRPRPATPDQGALF